ncbi:MAG: hypothetical protein EOP06_20010 [Proteobacteria bacterium]|nr:MAG: hypothetical protein EOP06_20010 [Pseudomonadota bacterium]
MKSIATFFLFALAGSISQADLIKCHFTEPFVVSIYDSTQSSLTYSAAAGATTVMHKVSMQTKAAGQFELKSFEGKLLQTLHLNNEGSDGMSDRVYAYDARDLTKFTSNRGVAYGGCEAVR